MTIEYYWHSDGYLSVGGSPADGRTGARLSATEFRDLVQCQARGALIITLANGRPRVSGRLLKDQPSPQPEQCAAAPEMRPRPRPAEDSRPKRGHALP